MTTDRVPTVSHRHVEVDGVRIFCREAGPAGAPTLLLLHGFPTASHQFRRLVDALGTRYRMIAPDYPGFGYSDAPRSSRAGGAFVYTFEHVADVIEGFVERIGLRRFVMYMFDYGAPVGFRLATRHPEWIAGLVVQNANAYDEGLSQRAREYFAARHGDAGAEDRIRGRFTAEDLRRMYLDGSSHPESIPPDGWTLDHHFLTPGERQQVQIDLTFDYHTNFDLYATWQRWLRRHHPPTLVIWGRNDPIFIEPGAYAYQRDIPEAALHLLDTGHFALDDKPGEVAALVADFLDRTWRDPNERQ